MKFMCVYTIFPDIDTAAFINFGPAEMWHLFEGGVYSRVAFIKLTAVTGRHPRAYVVRSYNYYYSILVICMIFEL